jgi:hypothetical protein
MAAILSGGNRRLPITATVAFTRLSSRTRLLIHNESAVYAQVDRRDTTNPASPAGASSEHGRKQLVLYASPVRCNCMLYAGALRDRFNIVGWEPNLRENALKKLRVLWIPLIRPRRLNY